MRKLTTLFAAICAIALGSCTSNDFEGITPDTPATQTRPDLTAGFDAEEQTKTYVDDSKNLHWHEADQISAFVGDANNLQYQFKGVTGDESGTFSYVSGGDAQASSLGQIYAVYPYAANATITNEGVISLTLPATQSYAENSFGKGANPMVAVTESIEDTFLPFMNTCGYLKLSLYNGQGAKLRRLELKGNAGEKIAGAATVTVTDGTPSLTMADGATTTVTLDCGEDGEALGSTAETATVLWLVLPETTFGSGITITATDTNGNVFVKSTNNEVVITRNKVQPMASLEATFAEPKPANNEIWYTATAKVTPYATGVFGATYKSTEWDSVTGKGVITFTGDVTTVGERAFYQKSLTSITLPESVTSIGYFAFSRCSQLTAFNGKFASADNRCIIVNNELIAFAPSGKTEYSIPEGVTSIAKGAFVYCTSLTSISIPEGVTSINGFANCTKLATVNIPESVQTVASGAFNGCTSLPIVDNIRYADTFLVGYTDKTLTSCNIKDGTRFIEQQAFMDCTSITSVIIPNTVEKIGFAAFKLCSSLTTITIPESVKSVGTDAFYGCDKLNAVYCKSITPPTAGTEMFEENSVGWPLIFVPTESVDEYQAAAGWKSYSSQIKGYDYSSVPANYEIWYTATEKVTPQLYESSFGANIKSNEWDSSTGNGVITFDGDINKIVSRSFMNCTALTGIVMPGSVTTISSFAFNGCENLKNVSLPFGLITIGGSAFSGCTALSEVTIPIGVASIGDYAFNGCQLLNFYCQPPDVPTMGKSMFDNYWTGFKIHVPTSSLYSYQNANNWSNYKSRLNAKEYTY